MTGGDCQALILVSRRPAGCWSVADAKQLPEPAKIGMSRRMGSKFRCLAPQIFVLQDHKRLPARFFARISGALSGLGG